MEDESGDEMGKGLPSNDSDSPKANESFDECEEDGLSDSRCSSHKDDDQLSNENKKRSSNSRIIQVSDDQLGRFASDELKLKQVRRPDGTPCWKKEGKVVFDGQTGLREYCIEEKADYLDEYLKAHEEVTIFELRPI